MIRCGGQGMFVIATYYNRFLCHDVQGWHTTSLDKAREFASEAEAGVVCGQLNERPVFAQLRLRVVPKESATNDLTPGSLELG